jgi:serine phosphatase RsbU (regulator of sigma subunit)
MTDPGTDPTCKPNLPSVPDQLGPASETWPEVELFRDICDPPDYAPGIVTPEKAEAVKKFSDEYETQRYVPASKLVELERERDAAKDELKRWEEAEDVELAALLATAEKHIARANHTEQLLAEARGEFERRAESKDMMHAARAGKSDYAAVCQGKAEAFREAAQFLASQGGEEGQ